MLATSALFTSVSFLSLRMRPGAFVPIKWRLPECPRLILPLAVILKRFLAPRCVFNFNFGFDAFLGIAGNPLDNLLCRLLAGGASPTLQNHGVAEEGQTEVRPYITLTKFRPEICTRDSSRQLLRLLGA